MNLQAIVNILTLLSTFLPMHAIIKIFWFERKNCKRNCFISFHHHVYIGEVAWVVTRLTGTSTITTRACCFVHHFRPRELGERTFPYIMYFTLKCWISKNTSPEVPHTWRFYKFNRKWWHIVVISPINVLEIKPCRLGSRIRDMEAENKNWYYLLVNI